MWQDARQAASDQHTGTSSNKHPGEIFDTVTSTDSALEFLPDVRVDIVRILYTFSSAKYAQTSEASGESRG